jgi:glutathione synthase/RimK-type ligase-like ATP-grasp enzyme
MGVKMKRIGILFGQENTFPQAFIERVNKKAAEMNIEVMAEAVKIDKVIQGEDLKYHIIIDRISQDVPFYRAYLKNAAASGTAVINNPFWWSADEKFFNNALMTKVGVPVPKTVILPSNQLPTDTSHNSFRNLSFPLDWEGIFGYIGFPAYFKPHSGGGWKSVYKVSNVDEFFRAYNETEQLVMMLQEEIQFEEYYRCYCLDRQDVWIMPYEPRNPHHLRYVQDAAPIAPEKHKMLVDTVLKINRSLGYDFNTVELALRNGVPYAIDFCNPAPDADVHSVGEANFEWIVEAAANMAIRRAINFREGINNLTWGDFIYSSANNMPIIEGMYDDSLKKKPKSKVSSAKKSKTVDSEPAEKKSKKSKAA